MINVSNIVYEYDNFQALRGVSCYLKPSSIVGLVGPNGAGKTTLMRCMATYQHPFTGEISIEGLSTTKQTRECHQHVRFLPDFSCFYESLSVIDFLEFMAAANKQIAKNPQVARSAVNLLGLEQYTHHKLKSLSRGWRQRVGIASMVVTGSRYLLLDEPASGLDPEARMKLAQVFLELKERGLGVLVSSHILDELDKYCDEVIVMQNGEIKEQFTTEATKDVEDSVTIEIKSDKPEDFKKFLEERGKEFGVYHYEIKKRDIKEKYLQSIRDKKQ